MVECASQIADSSQWKDNPIESFRDKQFVKCVVTSVDAKGRVELSMRSSLISAAENGQFAMEEEPFPKAGELIKDI